MKTCLHEKDSRSLTHDLKAEKTFFFSSCVHVAIRIISYKGPFINYVVSVGEGGEGVSPRTTTEMEGTLHTDL